MKNNKLYSALGLSSPSPKPTLLFNILKVVSQGFRKIPDTPKQIIERSEAISVSEPTVRKAKDKVEDLIDRYYLHLKEEYRNEISMRLVFVKMTTNDKVILDEIETFFRDIPNISDIYRIISMDYDYIVKINADDSNTISEIRHNIQNRTHVDVVRSIEIDSVVRTPHDEISCVLSSL